MIQENCISTCHKRLPSVSIRSHLAFTFLSAGLVLLLFMILRLLLFIYNRDLIGDTPVTAFLHAFGMGVIFDLQAVSYASIPLVFAFLSPRLMALRQWFCIWLSVFAGIALFVGMLELDFYREFHQRLNGLVFQYLAEDPVTVLSMLWHGFPVGRYVFGWSLMAWLFSRVVNWCERITRPHLATLKAGTMGVSK